MQPKKNPKADLTKSSGLFFAIGFALISALSYAGFEAKTYDKQIVDDRKSDVDKNLDEDVEDIVMETPEMPPPPPPPPAVVVEVEVVDNEKDIKEEIIQSTETTKEEVIQVADIKEVEVEEEEVDVPFTIIEDKPMFEACKNMSKAEQEKCFKQSLDNHVKKHFNYPPSALEMGIQGRVNVSFRINKDGSVTIVGVRGPDKSLEAEARRIIEKLPKLIPGKQRGKPTSVMFSYPIVFRLNN
ncbi:energy transducer TonB [Capnocytophaga sp.]|uniref:energy transducer TonB n=1 Tax=Capnocytophaga sp. TaxID=44737 RepID=UPI0026DD6F72|nr:energy transducer TonB [Capnocytophaga sp.]MDO5104422.1 energy transducer TonB [Capnocytophaga sp.]